MAWQTKFTLWVIATVIAYIAIAALMLDGGMNLPTVVAVILTLGAGSAYALRQDRVGRAREQARKRRRSK